MQTAQPGALPPDIVSVEALAREISYASSAQTRAGRALIRSVENLTGRLALLRMAGDYAEAAATGSGFWDMLVERYRLTPEIVGGSLASIPPEGPVVVISNHPYGILDGLMTGWLLARARGDFRIVANSVFRKARELDRVILPISFDPTPEAQRLNIATRRAALDYLGQGGCIAIFPGGTVSTARTPFGRPMDPRWRSFTARMIARSGAAVVPLYFDGQNSRLFQIASHLHQTLRLALLIKEFRVRVGAPVRMVLGEALPRAEIAARATDPAALMTYLREETYRLSPEPLRDLGNGFDFELAAARRKAG
ncbi:lysophospholipid acyltransferase family protein [Oceanicella sp. SM1341]|uniref:lysophospholipid acyltransferase family protein n=1 Tax=Oceanicella sp. SM1341 TaxID=1548889 RepID=UPI001E61FF1D|nr:lysophospholipid acyltransferase family protein [Oceanicella sp. SM1341]